MVDSECVIIKKWGERERGEINIRIINLDIKKEINQIIKLDRKCFILMKNGRIAYSHGNEEAYSRGFSDVLIEMEHLESFNFLRRQNYKEALREHLVEPIRAINACNPLLSSVSEHSYRVYMSVLLELSGSFCGYICIVECS